MERPNVDTRVKTEDVTATSGMTFRDFNLADSVQFVSHTLFHSDSLLSQLGYFRDGLRASLPYSGASYSEDP